MAAGQRTPAETLATWMNSPGHRGNSLNGRFSEVGLGILRGANGAAYWTQVFGYGANR